MRNQNHSSFYLCTAALLWLPACESESSAESSLGGGSSVEPPSAPEASKPPSFEDPNEGPAPCQSNADCEDGDACTEHRCVSGTCVSDAVALDDGNACTVDDCDSLSGPFHLEWTPDDGDACTVERCEPSSGEVVSLPRETSDGDACTVDSCDALTGLVHQPAVCSDQNVCTLDLCDSQDGCAFPVHRMFHETFGETSAFKLSGPLGLFEVGQPVLSKGQSEDTYGDPTKDTDGSHYLLGTRIGENLPDAETDRSDPETATSEEVDLSGESGLVILKWDSVLNVDGQHQIAVVEVWRDGAWQVVEDAGPSAEADWTAHSADVTAFKSSDFRVRFRIELQRDGNKAPVVSGWSIDNVRLVPDWVCP